MWVLLITLCLESRCVVYIYDQYKTLEECKSPKSPTNNIFHFVKSLNKRHDSMETKCVGSLWKHKDIKDYL